MNRYGYDFDTAIGTPVHAARAGTVARAEGSHFDGQVAPTGLDNYLVLQHADGTFGLYGHFTHDGVFVGTGESVDAGDLVGRSGNTGNTANIPHLHFSVHPCDPFVGGSAGCPSLPVTFRNTDANPTGLQNGRVCPALPY